MGSNFSCVFAICLSSVVSYLFRYIFYPFARDWLYPRGFIFWAISFCFVDLPICLFLHQHQTVFISAALRYVLKLGTVALQLCYLQLCRPYWASCLSIYTLELVNSHETHWYFDGDCVESLG